jgi:hypothetical protein
MVTSLIILHIVYVGHLRLDWFAEWLFDNRHIVVFLVIFPVFNSLVPDYLGLLKTRAFLKLKL